VAGDLRTIALASVSVPVAAGISIAVTAGIPIAVTAIATTLAAVSDIGAAGNAVAESAPARVLARVSGCVVVAGIAEARAAWG
jgi:hypothetical protein